jgi:hypothetical protein
LVVLFIFPAVGMTATNSAYPAANQTPQNWQRKKLRDFRHAGVILVRLLRLIGTSACERPVFHHPVK